MKCKNYQALLCYARGHKRVNDFTFTVDHDYGRGIWETGHTFMVTPE